VKYIGLRNQLAALRAKLPQRGLVIKIEGGLPENYTAKPVAPPGGDLKAQAKAFRKSRPTPTPDAALARTDPERSPSPAGAKKLGSRG
jgi:hypothetical protein